jgi:hypothetical protein
VWFFNYNKAVMAYQPWLKGLQPNATELAFQYYESSGSTSPRRPRSRRPSRRPAMRSA